MARLFDDGSSEYLQIESFVITSYPLAMACWFNVNDDSVSQQLMGIADKDVTNYNIRLKAACAVEGKPVQTYVHNYGQPSAAFVYTSTGLTINTWHHACGMWLSVSERHAYIDGGSKGSEIATTVGAMVNHDRFAIGADRDSSPGSYMSGMIAEAAIWNLTDWGANDAEREINFEKVIASLAKGFTPDNYLLGLVAYWPLVRGLTDEFGGYNLTANGTVVVAHPRIIQPCGIL